MWLSSLSARSDFALFRVSNNYEDESEEKCIQLESGVTQCSSSQTISYNCYNIGNVKYSSSNAIYPVVSLTGGILVEKEDGSLAVE